MNNEAEYYKIRITLRATLRNCVNLLKRQRKGRRKDQEGTKAIKKLKKSMLHHKKDVSTIVQKEDEYMSVSN